MKPSNTATFGGPSQSLGRARIREEFLECTQVYGERALAERVAAAARGMSAAATLTELTRCIDALVKDSI